MRVKEHPISSETRSPYLDRITHATFQSSWGVNGKVRWLWLMECLYDTHSISIVLITKRFLYCYVLMYFDTDRFTHNHETVAIDTALGCAIICARFSEILKTILSAISSASSLTNTYFTTFVHAIILSMIFRKTVRGDHDTIEISSLVI